MALSSGALASTGSTSGSVSQTEALARKLSRDPRAGLRLWSLRRIRAAVKPALRIGTMDLKIASIALTQDATVLTKNLKDFGRVPGLRVEDWTRP